jgi:hypothetical protein
MEIKFTEIDDLNLESNNYINVKKYNQNNDTDLKNINTEYNSEKYWEQNTVNNSNNTLETKKKKVTFDDILLSMNLVVNQNGVLQYMAPRNLNNNNNEQNNYKLQNKQTQNRLVNNSKKNTVNPTALDPQVKNSFIYNKYFKNYKEENISIPEVRQPKTLEEYNRMVLEDKIKRIQEKIRISNIKSTKLLFTNTGNIQASKNNLRKMYF